MNPLSIGSFFHEDLAYLAALEANGKLAPEVERKQNAWWKLLLWYLNDDLKAVEQSLHGQPFLDWVPRQEGAADGTPVFDRITWLERDHRVIGLVSPVLLVRPLPDENLGGKVWEEPAPITDRVRGRLTELVKNLTAKSEETRHRGASPFCCRLEPVISAHHATGLANSLSSDVVLTPFSFLDPYTLESTKILVPTGDGAYLIPMCVNPNCSEPLLPATVNLQLEAKSFTLTCRKCSTSKPFQLSDFGCAWVDGEFVVWRDRALQWADTTGSVRMPPVPVVDPNRGTVKFSYPAVSALANVEARDLTLALQQGSPVRSIDRLTDLNYPNYLWPGDPDPKAPVTAVPIPLRIENANLVSSARTRKINNTVEVTLSLKGLPASIYWIFIPSTIATSSIVIYPDPNKMPPTWSWFDIATDDLQMRLPAKVKAARTIGDHRVRTETTAGSLPAIELSSAGGSGTAAGSCSLLLLHPDTGEVTSPIEFFFGFDFGSSNTAMRFSLDGTRKRSLPLASSDLRSTVAQLTVSPASNKAADRVVPKSAGPGSSFQSFHCQAHHVARVTATPCCNALTNGDVLFKSDERWENVRIEYVSEMLTHGLIGASCHLGAHPLQISGVFSYPLTFTKGRLEKFVAEVKTVIERVSGRTGGDATTAVTKTQFVDEATAGVASLGQPQEHELVLTADLGGGTLDISIGRSSDGPNKDQIGSAEVGGAHFVRRGENVAELQAYVTTVSKIARGEADRGEWSSLKPHVDRYYQLLFIFLESVLGSYIVRHAKHDPVEKVSVYPLGNGWRFHELMVDRMQVEPEKVVRKEIERLTTNLATAIQAQHGVTLDLRHHPVDNPKGAVADGCLAVATMAGEHNATEVMPRLPVGIDSSNGSTKVAWHELFHDDVAKSEFVNNGLDFDEKELRARLQTPNGKNWAVEDFNEGALRGDLQTRAYYWEGAGFTRGPLQLLIEKQWLPKA